MNTNDTILDAIDPELAERIVTRRDEIAQGATTSSRRGRGARHGVRADRARRAERRTRSRSASPTVTDVLNFALTLEIFENEFYKAVLGTSSSAAQNAAFATVRAQVPAAAVTAIQQIQKHEAAHVAFAAGQPGATNVFNLTADSFDFTGSRGAGNGPFAAATTDLALPARRGAGRRGHRRARVQGTGAEPHRPTAPCSRRRCAFTPSKRGTRRRSAACVARTARRRR